MKPHATHAIVARKTDRPRRGIPVACILLAAGLCSPLAAGTTPVDLQYYRSDVDGNGKVDADDLQIWIDTYTAASPPADRTYFFSEGDINHDGLVDGNDYTIWNAEYDPNEYLEPSIPSMGGITTDAYSDNLDMSGNIIVSEGEISVTDSYGFPMSMPPQTIKLMDPFLPILDINGNHRRVWQAPGSSPMGTSPHLEPTITIETTDLNMNDITDGFDLVVEWDNVGGTAPMNFGIVRIPFIMFGPEVYVRNFTQSSEETLFNPSDPMEIHEQAARQIYPGEKYAPCMTIRGFIAENQDVDRIESDWPDLAGANENDYYVPIGQDSTSDFYDWWAADAMDLADVQYSEPAGAPTPKKGDAGDFREYVMGVSVIHPVLENDFKTSFQLQRYRKNFAGRDSIYWNLSLVANPAECPRDTDGERLRGMLCTGVEYPQSGRDDGRIHPGEKKSMRITVRFYRPLSWYEDISPTMTDSHRGTYLNLFRDYRRYFKKQYGDVQYDADGRPIMRVDGGTAGQGSTLGVCDVSHNNPWGFAIGNGSSYNNFTELDDFYGLGWDRYTSETVIGVGVPPFSTHKGTFEVVRDRGFYRQIIVGPSGNICTQSPCPISDYNWPNQISTRWNQTAKAETPMGESYHDHPILTTLGALGDWIQRGVDLEEDEPREIGFWWGRATLPAHREFNDLTGCFNVVQELLDITENSDTREATLNDIDGMRDSGIYSLGLDASILLPVGDRYHWLQILRHDSRSNWVERFYTEFHAADFEHTLQPTYFQITKASSPIRELPGGPHAIIDFLNKIGKIFIGVRPHDHVH